MTQPSPLLTQTRKSLKHEQSKVLICPAPQPVAATLNVET